MDRPGQRDSWGTEAITRVIRVLAMGRSGNRVEGGKPRAWLQSWPECHGDASYPLPAPPLSGHLQILWVQAPDISQVCLLSVPFLSSVQVTSLPCSTPSHVFASPLIHTLYHGKLHQGVLRCSYAYLSNHVFQSLSFFISPHWLFCWS